MLKKIKRKVNHLINLVFIVIFRVIHINDKEIVFNSCSDLTDNAFAIYDYMRSNDYLKVYKAVWLVDDIDKINKKLETEKSNFPNTKFVNNSIDKVNFERDKLIASGKWFLTDHGNPFGKRSRKRKKQIYIDLWHGVGYKARSPRPREATSCDALISMGNLSSDFLSYFRFEPMDKIIELGYPRNDYLFTKSPSAICFINKLVGSQRFILWMPTFRASILKNISENYEFSQTGLPILDDTKKVNGFNSFLKKHNITIVIKIHPLQMALPIFKSKFSNIKFLTNDLLEDADIQLYQIVGLSDALITDYSSIAVDYLLVNKPILYTLDDYEKYARSRGFWKENTLDYMPGYHIYTYAQFLDAIEEVNNGVDKYESERKRLLPLYHKYVDGNSSKRILDYFGIVHE